MGNFKKLAELLSEEFGVVTEKLQLNTKIEEDLRITGDDGVDFLEYFIERFDIQYDPNKEWQWYFESEGLDLLNLIGLFNWLRGKKKPKKHDLTIRHLLKIIDAGYWIDME